MLVHLQNLPASLSSTGPLSIFDSTQRALDQLQAMTSTGCQCPLALSCAAGLIVLLQSFFAKDLSSFSGNGKEVCESMSMHSFRGILWKLILANPFKGRVCNTLRVVHQKSLQEATGSSYLNWRCNSTFTIVARHASITQHMACAEALWSLLSGMDQTLDCSRNPGAELIRCAFRA